MQAQCQRRVGCNDGLAGLRDIHVENGFAGHLLESRLLPKCGNEPGPVSVATFALVLRVVMVYQTVATPYLREVSTA